MTAADDTANLKNSTKEYERSGVVALTGERFRRRVLWKIFYAWNIPAVFGLSFIMLIGVLTPDQLAGILITPLEPTYIIAWLAFAMWYLPRQVRPVADFLDGTEGSSAEAAFRAVQRFSFQFWATFLAYLVLAPFSVIIAAEIYTDFVATPLALFRIELVAIIVSIIVGLPIFFLMLDLFGEALGGVDLKRPVVTVKTKVFLIGALIPLLIDTILVQYFWTRTGFFSAETFAVWLLLELLAIAGSLIFVRSFGQSLAPLQSFIGARDSAGATDVSALVARSIDELGVLTNDYRALLTELQTQNEVLELNNRLLRGSRGSATFDEIVDEIIAASDDAVGGDKSYLMLLDDTGTELISVAHTGAPYQKGGHFRVRLEEQSLVGEAVRTRKTTSAADVLNDPRCSEILGRQLGTRSVMAVPLEVDGKLIGVLATTRRDAPHVYTSREILLMETLAREASVALQAQRLREARAQAEEALRNLNAELEKRVEERTAEFSRLNRELKTFAYSVSHDLRAPLRAIDGFSQNLLEDYSEKLDQTGRDFLERVRRASQRMGGLIDDLLMLSRVTSADLKASPIDMSEMAAEIIDELRTAAPDREVTVNIENGLRVLGDPGLVRIALHNLLENAWKYTAKVSHAHIDFGKKDLAGETVYFVKDNGAGFDTAYAGHLFGPFQRLHGQEQFSGSGIGLATCQRIIDRHHGRIWAEAQVDRGATFFFTLPGLGEWKQAIPVAGESAAAS